jgi:hypothetical protein
MLLHFADQLIIDAFSIFAGNTECVQNGRQLTPRKIYVNDWPDDRYYFSYVHAANACVCGDIDPK